mgnify:CR=1 FL=1|jgi:hypothetical protein
MEINKKYYQKLLEKINKIFLVKIKLDLIKKYNNILLIINKIKIINKFNNFMRKLNLYILYGIKVIKILIFNSFIYGLIK